MRETLIQSVGLVEHVGNICRFSKQPNVQYLGCKAENWYNTEDHTIVQWGAGNFFVIKSWRGIPIP